MCVLTTNESWFKQRIVCVFFCIVENLATSASNPQLQNKILSRGVIFVKMSRHDLNLNYPRANMKCVYPKVVEAHHARRFLGGATIYNFWF